jgi:thiosulfate reductase cytochrome b subunit
MSGLTIFNAHPALYFGKKSTFDAPILEMKAVTADALASGAAGNSAQALTPLPAESTTPATDNAADDEEDEEEEEEEDTPNTGVVTLFGHALDTTGWFGFAYGSTGELVERAFPSWMTLPGAQDLATARRWHFLFAWLLVLNGLVYLLFGLFSGHIRRDLWARRREWRSIGHEIVQHAKLRFAKGEDARHYNVLQKITYLIVIFIMLPLIVLAGIAMSPGLNALFPQILSVFGGRQSARTIHFILAFGLVAFVIVHVVMVILSGFANNVRSMITGRYDLAVTREKAESPQTSPHNEPEQQPASP